MNTSPLSSSFSSISSGSLHTAQFFGQDNFLIQSVAEFIRSGLENGEGVLIVATQDHLDAFSQILLADDFDVQPFVNKGQLRFRDAEKKLEVLMQANLTSEIFNQLLGEEIRAISNQFTKVKVYGEMVSILWREGNLAGVLALEEQWNRLSALHPFKLLCGYSLSDFNKENQGLAFSEVCRAHSHVVPTESFTELKHLDTQTREIARLQQRASTLESEVEARKRAEGEARKHAEELARANEDLTRITYIASHDLKEPLRTVTLYLQLLKKKNSEKLDKEAQDYIDFALEGTQRVWNLIDGILLHARIEMSPKALRATSWNSAFDEAVGNLQFGIKNSGAKVTRGNLPTTQAEPMQIVQLFQNLIGNAIKFHNGSAPVVTVTVQQERNSWIFSVEDNGIGIPSEHSDSIFELFQRLHPADKYPGSGIGLATCKKIIESMGGKIWVEPPPRQGAVFKFRIPNS